MHQPSIGRPQNPKIIGISQFLLIWEMFDIISINKLKRHTFESLAHTPGKNTTNIFECQPEEDKSDK